MKKAQEQKVDKRSKAYRDSLKKRPILAKGLLHKNSYTEQSNNPAFPKPTPLYTIADFGKVPQPESTLVAVYTSSTDPVSKKPADSHDKQLKDLWATIAVLQTQVNDQNEKINRLESVVG